MSSLKDLASLIMIPSLYKDGRLDTVKPLGNSIIHPDATGNNDGTDGSTPAEGNFTFSRGSNLAATRVDVNGLIEKGRENRFLQSNNFNTSWTLSAASITSGHSGYDGTNNAWELIESATTAEHLIRQTPSFGGVVTLSVYAKANTRDWLWLRGVTGGANIRAWFDLSNGTTGGSSGSLIDYTMTSAGGGWWRCSLTLNHDAAFEYYIGLSSADGSAGYAGDGSSSIYIQDAQLEAGLVATDYIETGASTAQAGILEDMPRLDYSGGASCPALLLEPQRTNLLTHSEYFDAWSNDSNTSLTANAITSPSGFVDAYKMSAGTSNARQSRILNVSVSGSLAFSSYAKKGEYSVVQFSDAVDANLYANFDLENGVLGNYNNCTPSIEDVGDGWYRCIITWTASSNINKVRISIAESTTQGRLVNFAGNGTDGIYIYGAQLEAGSYPTSYIPTYGSSVTRSLDSCLATSVSDVIGQTQGTMFIDLTIDNLSSQTNNPIPLTLKGSGSTSSYIQVYTSGRVQAVHYGFGSLQANINLPSYGLTDGRHKFAFVYNGNDFRFYIDGALAGSDTSGLVDSQSEIHLGYYNTSFNGTTNNHQAVLFPTALTDSECIALTTL